MEIEEVSKHQVVMLDLLVTKVRTEGEYRLAWQPFVKATARHIPLGADSWHSTGVHRAWPRAEVNIMYNRSSTYAAFKKFKEMKLQRFRHHFLEPKAIQRAEAFDPLPLPPQRNSTSRKEESLEGKPQRTIRIVLPFHPQLKGIPGRLQRTMTRWTSELERLGLFMHVQVSWCSGGKPLFAIMQKCKW